VLQEGGPWFGQVGHFACRYTLAAGLSKNVACTHVKQVTRAVCAAILFLASSSQACRGRQHGGSSALWVCVPLLLVSLVLSKAHKKGVH
jgi:hypothetical protein